MIKGRVRKIINVSGTLMVQRIANEATSVALHLKSEKIAFKIRKNQSV